MRRILTSLLLAAGLAACGDAAVTSNCMPQTCQNGGAAYTQCCDSSHCTYNFTKTNKSCTCGSGAQCENCAAELQYYCINN